MNKNRYSLKQILCDSWLFWNIDVVKDAGSAAELKEECLTTGVASVDRNKEERRLSESLIEDLRRICTDFQLLPLKLYMDAIVNFLDDQ